MVLSTHSPKQTLSNVQTWSPSASSITDVDLGSYRLGSQPASISSSCKVYLTLISLRLHMTLFLVSSASGHLQFTRPVYPASLTIELNSHISEVVWVTECINHLPFLDHLRRLEIKISSGRNDLILPASAHYEALCCLLQPLQRPTLLVHIIFSVDVRRFIDIGVDDFEEIRVREAARLGEAFASLIKAGGFSAQLVVQYRRSEENPTAVAMQCSV